MSIPAGITGITVTGKYVAPDGTALTGYVVFTPSINAADSTDNAIVPAVPYKVTLDGTGSFSKVLAATDDTTWNAPGWTYQVQEVLTAPQGGITRNTYNIEVPTASGGGALDLADALVVTLPGTPSQYLQKAGGTMAGNLTLATGVNLVLANNGVVQVGDANLYRSAADTLKTDDSLHVAATLRHLGSSAGFFNAAAVTKPTVTGSRGSNAALASLLTALANLGLITDSSS